MLVFEQAITVDNLHEVQLGGEEEDVMQSRLGL